jgi:hypothetical protein
VGSSGYCGCKIRKATLSDASGVWKWMLRRVATDKHGFNFPASGWGFTCPHGCCSSRPWTAKQDLDYETDWGTFAAWFLVRYTKLIGSSSSSQLQLLLDLVFKNDLFLKNYLVTCIINQPTKTNISLAPLIFRDTQYHFQITHRAMIEAKRCRTVDYSPF